jgi:hypothetical protein
MRFFLHVDVSMGSATAEDIHAHETWYLERHRCDFVTLYDIAADIDASTGAYALIRIRPWSHFCHVYQIQDKPIQSNHLKHREFVVVTYFCVLDPLFNLVPIDNLYAL